MNSPSDGEGYRAIIRERVTHELKLGEFTKVMPVDEWAVDIPVGNLAIYFIKMLMTPGLEFISSLQNALELVYRSSTN